MKKRFGGHSVVDFTGLEGTVETLRALLGRANTVLPNNPHLEGYRDSLVLALEHAEKALEQF